MCTNYPITLEELANIQGVGAGKAQKYGQEFVAIIKQYVEDNEIERAQDMVVKPSPTNPSSRYISSRTSTAKSTWKISLPPWG